MRGWLKEDIERLFDRSVGRHCKQDAIGVFAGREQACSHNVHQRGDGLLFVEGSSLNVIPIPVAVYESVTSKLNDRIITKVDYFIWAKFKTNGYFTVFA